MEVTSPNLSQITLPGGVDNTKSPDLEALRRVATQFESLLLSQLTASMNPSEDEGGLFANSPGMGLSRQMFSEQLAQTMAQSGGIGLADMIMKQLTERAENKLKASLKDKGLNVASITGEASGFSNSAKVVATEAEVLSGKEAAGLTIHATRPRRVHAVEANNLISASPLERSNRAEALTVLNQPIQGNLRSVFGPRRDPINGRMRFHKGIDLAARAGTPIGAAAEGTVVFSGRNKGYGNMVMLEHADGRRTLYAHASRLFVKVGDQVRRGQTIAAVGSTGHSTGPHLHFEVRQGNVALNPLKNISNGLMVARR
jgi:peptidoglycan hydrolase FlgJ